MGLLLRLLYQVRKHRVTQRRGRGGGERESERQRQERKGGRGWCRYTVLYVVNEKEITWEKVICRHEAGAM